jgi:hypothetical protein
VYDITLHCFYKGNRRFIYGEGLREDAGGEVMTAGGVNSIPSSSLRDKAHKSNCMIAFDLCFVVTPKYSDQMKSNAAIIVGM